MGEVSAADRVVGALAAAGVLAPGAEAQARDVVAHALAAEPPAEPAAEPPRTQEMPRLVEVVAYLGGALVVAAGFLFVVRSWDDLGDVGQVSFLAAVAVVLGVAGFVAMPVQGGPLDAADVRRRLSGTLLTGAALAAGVAAGVALEVFTDATFRDVAWPMVLGGSLVTLIAAAAYRVSPTAVGLVGMLGGALAATTDLGAAAATEPAYESLGVGAVIFAVASLWVLVTELGVFSQQPTVARALGVAVAVVGAQAASFSDDLSWIGYLMSVVVAAVGVWLYLTRLDWPYLAGAVVALTLVVPEAVSDWTEGSLGAVGGVLVAGITLLAASYAGYRLRRQTTD